MGSAAVKGMVFKQTWGLFTWREEDPRRRNNFLFGLHAEIAVGVVAGKQIKLLALSS